MMWNTGDYFDYFQCSRCRCLQISAIPADMTKYYPADYYSYHEPIQPKRGAIQRYLLRSRDMYAFNGTGLPGHLLHLAKPAMPILNDMGHAGIGTDSRILDVGCGNGETINYLSHIGFTRLAGVDPYATRDATGANGVRVFKRTVHAMEGTFDFILFNNSFEHMADPADTLQAVYRLLPAGGICLLKIPTVASYAWEEYGVNWVQLDAPRHFFLYTPDNIRRLAADAGMAVIDIVYDSTEFQFWGSEQYSKSISLHADNSYLVSPEKSIFSPGQIKSYRRRSKELNALKQGDSIAVYLKKG
jgi:SAM-dependent methyltransferase